MIYRRRASPLHATRAAAGAAYCLVLACVALVFEHPLVLAAVAVAALSAAAGARVGRDVVRSVRYTVPLAVLVALVNALVVRDGLTVLARLGELPPFGRIDVTAEALVSGGVLGVRVLVVVWCCALFTAAVDPDEVLRLFRRVSFRSALTAALATRLVPVLARDARRMTDARACRPRPGPRVAVLRAVATGALDRAIDVAATLEVRGYGAAGAARPERAPWSRHDVAFAAVALALAVLAVGARLAGVADFAAYPRLSAPVGGAEVALACALVLVALAPFADRRGIER
ncbi:MAG TPA: energy-coupling factor transporter transmembrane component T [Solirubrobacteraceae bacterium]